MSGLVQLGTMVDSASATLSSPSTKGVHVVPRRRNQKGSVFLRGNKWVGTYREAETDPLTGKRIRRKVTFGPDVTSKRAAEAALQPYLDRVRDDTKAMLLPAPSKGGKKLCSLIDEWKAQILPNRKLGGARACESHIRTYLIPILGDKPLRELSLREHQSFILRGAASTDSPADRGNVYC